MLASEQSTSLLHTNLTSLSLSVSVGSKDGVTAAADKAFVKLYILSNMNLLSYPCYMCNVSKSPACLLGGWMDLI